MGTSPPELSLLASILKNSQQIELHSNVLSRLDEGESATHAVTGLARHLCLGARLQIRLAGADQQYLPVANPDVDRDLLLLERVGWWLDQHTDWPHPGASQHLAEFYRSALEINRESTKEGHHFLRLSEAISPVREEACRIARTTPISPPTPLPSAGELAASGLNWSKAAMVIGALMTVLQFPGTATDFPSDVSHLMDVAGTTVHAVAEVSAEVGLGVRNAESAFELASSRSTTPQVLPEAIEASDAPTFGHVEDDEDKPNLAY